MAGGLGLTPSDLIVVSDTIADLAMASAAGAALKVGVLGGAGDADALHHHADVVIDSVDEIQIDGQP